MKKNDARIIVNLNLTDEDLENKVELAVADYINKCICSDKIEELIRNRTQSVMEQRLDEIFHYGFRRKVDKFNIDGHSYSAKEIIEKEVEKLIAEFMSSEKIAKMIIKKLYQSFNIESDSKSKEL